MNRIVSTIEVAVALVGLAIVTPPLRGADLVVANVDTLNCRNTDVPGFLAGGFTVTGFSFDSNHAVQVENSGQVNIQLAQFGDFTVTKSIDACSPLLFEKMANSGHIPKVTFSWTSGIGSDFQLTYLTITLEDTLITAWNYDGGQETVSFSWSKITTKFIPQKADGSLGAPIQTVVIRGLITGFTLNPPPLRNDFGGFAGMQLRVGPNPLSVLAVGRVCVGGNSQTHTVKLVSESSKGDIPGGSAQVNMLNCLPGQFVYTNLASPITLAPATTYYLVSQEFQNGDKFYEHGSITFRADASVISSVYFNGVNWIAIDGANSSYVPPDLGYTTLPAPAAQAFVLDYNQNNQALRNNFTGFVGMNLKVGGSVLKVASVGRVCVAGNSQTHTVKFVNTATGVDLPGGSAVVSMGGCTASQFVYTNLTTPLTLQPNTSYYLVSQEASGGDQWYDQSTLRTRTDATVNGAVFSNPGGYAQQPGLNNSYVPANFLYQVLP